jgi:flagellar biosynthesis chaperone FliJ
MKRFSFPLDRVLDWKGVVSQQEQLALDTLRQQRDEITSSLLNLSEQIDTLSRDTHEAGTGQELAYSAQARSSMMRHRTRTEAQRAHCDTKIVTQQNKLRVVETERRLLDRLKEKSQSEWQLTADREMEATASDLFLGSWRRR